MVYCKKCVEQGIIKEIIQWYNSPFDWGAWHSYNYAFNIEKGNVKTFSNDNVSVTVERCHNFNKVAIIHISSKTKGFMRSLINCLLINGIKRVECLDVIDPKLYAHMVKMGFKPLGHYYGSYKSVLQNLFTEKKI